MNRRDFIRSGTALFVGAQILGSNADWGDGVETTVIDMHCHILTSKDLAIRGFVRRHGAHTGVPDWIIEAALDVIELFEKSEKGTMDLEDIEEPYRDFLDAIGQYDDLPDEIADRIFQLATENKDLVVGPLGKQSLRNMLAWVFLMLNRPGRVANIMATTYPKVRIFTPMMVDFDGWVLEDKAQFSTKKQIQNFEELVKERIDRTQPSNTGKPYLHPIISFNPLKALPSQGYPQSEADRYVGMVKDAVLKRGFLGIKLYPPAGFRPTANSYNDLKKVVDHRYRRPTLATEIDSVMSEIFSFCSREEVPIAAHCTPTGAQSSPQHESGLNADPYYWYLVLKDRRYPRLRINLNHFGKNHTPDTAADLKVLRAEDYPRNQPWTACIAWMMREFPGRLFADIGFFTFENEDYNQIFLTTFKEFHKEMATQLMYGSDWHMLRQSTAYKTFFDKQSSLFKELFREAIGDTEEAREAHRNFLGGNALRYLGLVKSQPGYRRLNCYYYYVLGHRSPKAIGAYSQDGWFSPKLPWDCPQP
jgi:predicted TIM-barrel fold metal-dependent hydrolase